MEIFDMEKVIDENKQGQSLVLDQKEGNTKKLLSYCNKKEVWLKVNNKKIK